MTMNGFCRSPTASAAWAPSAVGASVERRALGGGRSVTPRRAATVLSSTATIRIAPWTRLIR